MQLTDATHGQALRVTRVDGEGPNSLRIMEMGLVSGTSVTVVGAAALGGPLQISIGDSSIAVRRTDAALIHVATA